MVRLKNSLQIFEGILLSKRLLIVDIKINGTSTKKFFYYRDGRISPRKLLKFHNESRNPFSLSLSI